MSAPSISRRWPIYSMPVGSMFFIANPTQCLIRNLRQRAADHGMKLSIRKATRENFVCVMRVM